LENLKIKVDQGADKIITQFFFDHEKFLRFRDKSIALGIKAPIIPGILPIGNFKKVKDFSLKCGTSIPKWIEEKFSNLKEEEKFVGAELACDLINKLQAEGVNEFHFYTLNKYELTYAVCKNLLNIKKTEKKEYNQNTNQFFKQKEIYI
ncbi:MAG: 5,10-methylenetetrahydrofolate reductase, partial [Proteobacteria bacterium]|nr:5,10-methylenetetrahydrofolate reductase [Pseudomonadota bacterium]